MSFSAYTLAKETRERRYAEYNTASKALALAQIKERLAEIKSQHEPIASLLEKKMDERERLHAIAFYVVVGRLPFTSEGEER